MYYKDKGISVRFMIIKRGKNEYSQNTRDLTFLVFYHIAIYFHVIYTTAQIGLLTNLQLVIVQK